MRAVRITDRNGNELAWVHLSLTENEARQMHDFLEGLTDEEGDHVHVMDDRFWEMEPEKRVEREIVVSRFTEPS
jgi:hypothetical protein